MLEISNKSLTIDMRGSEMEFNESSTSTNPFDDPAIQSRNYVIN